MFQIETSKFAKMMNDNDANDQQQNQQLNQNQNENQNENQNNGQNQQQNQQVLFEKATLQRRLMSRAMQVNCIFDYDLIF